MEKEAKLKIIRIAAAIVLLIILKYVEYVYRLPTWQLFMMYLIPYLIVGYDVLHEAIEGLTEGEALNESFLMGIATVGALCIGFFPSTEPQFTEGVLVMLLFQVGELFEHAAEDKSRDSIEALMDIRPDTASVVVNGEVITVNPSDVKVGEIIIVKPGERVPLDGIVSEGRTSIDASMLTGESVPQDVSEGDEVYSGSINIYGLIKIEVKKEYSESTAMKILELVENASHGKSKSETFIRKFAVVYTPIVVGLAVILALIPPILSGDFAGNISTWLIRALTFLVVSCPCALVISVPLTFFGGIGGASAKGILIKGGQYMEALANAGTVIFDKTGTLTKGNFEVTAVHPSNISEDELIRLVVLAESASLHPIANSLREYHKAETGAETVEGQVGDIEELTGYGVKAKVNGDEILAGNMKMMSEAGISFDICEHTGTIVHVAKNGEYIGHIVVSDALKEDSKYTVEKLKTLGLRETVMLTGDRADVAESVKNAIGIDRYFAELLPQDKVEHVKKIQEETEDKHRTIFVGDGMNDAPVLATADVGIAMGAIGSDAAIEAADIVLMDDKLSKLVEAVNISRKTIGIAKQNIVFSIAVKLAVLGLATIGLAGMEAAVFADVGVMVIATLNASRAIRTSGKA